MPDQEGNPLVTERPREVYVYRFTPPALYDGPPVAADDVLSVYVVLNGALGMSPGKSAAQAFHCGWMFAFDDAPSGAWQEQGRRVVVRVAETPHVFERVTAECDGYALQDEGLTETKRGAVTAFVTRPYRRGDVPKILTHKKCPLL
jgi:peptidyl-tRNA hydrolase